MNKGISKIFFFIASVFTRLLWPLPCMTLAVRWHKLDTECSWRLCDVLYGVVLQHFIPTLLPAEFGRVYAAKGVIFIVSAIIWGLSR